MADPAVLVRWVERASSKLQEHGVRHALVGGLALAVHGYARATVDIDLLIDEVQLPETRIAFTELGLLQTDRKVLTFRKVKIFRTLAPEDLDGEPLMFDALMTTPILCASALERVVRAELLQHVVPIASVEDLILLKLMRNDERDHLDIKELAKVCTFDRPYLEAQATVVGLRDELAAILERVDRQP